MTKTELIQALHDHVKIDGEKIKKADLKVVLEGLAEVVKKEAVQMGDKEKIVLTDIVSIKKRLVPEKPARMGRNPATGENVRIPKKAAHMKLVAKIEKSLKDAVLGKRAKKR